MHYFLLPILPLTIVGAIFFKKRLAAYGFPIFLVLIKMLMTEVSAVYFFMGIGLFATVFMTQKLMKETSAISLPRVAIAAAAGVAIYALASNFGVWVLGGCVADHERLYALNFSGLLACYKAALPYAGIHFLKAVPLTLILVQAIQWFKQLNVVLNLQRLTARH